MALRLVSDLGPPSTPPRPPPPDDASEWLDRLVMRTTKAGTVPDDVMANAAVALAWHPEWRGVVALDRFQQSVVCTRPPPWSEHDAPEDDPNASYPRPWSDTDSARAMSWMLRADMLGIKIGKDAIDTAVQVAADMRTIDPPRDYVLRCAFDPSRRLVGALPSALDPKGSPSWLTTYLGVIDSEYTRRVGRWFLIATIARTLRPGCKVDNVLILEGPQGAHKSSAVRALFGAWFSDTPLDIASKDRFSSIQGVWGYELAEFDGYGKHESAALKAFVTSREDKFRPAYARRDIRAPRRCVFIATINPGAEYLQDETGGRRWWPVRVGVTHTIDVDGLARDRDRIFAEARELYESRERWYPTTPEEHASCRAEQADRQSVDAWADPVRTYLAAPHRAGDDVTVADVLSNALGLEKRQWDRGSQMRVAAVLRAEGFARVRLTTGPRGYVYRRTDA